MPHVNEIANMKVGIWDIESGTDGTIDTSTLLNTSDITNMDEVRVISITAIASSTDATIQIDNRSVVTIPANNAITLSPNGTVVNPVIIFTDTASYVIEFVTNNKRGFTRGNI